MIERISVSAVSLSEPLPPQKCQSLKCQYLDTISPLTHALIAGKLLMAIEDSSSTFLTSDPARLRILRSQVGFMRHLAAMSVGALLLLVVTVAWYLGLLARSDRAQ